MSKKYYFTFLYNEHEDWTTGTCINNPIPHPPIYILYLEKKYATQLLKKITLGPDVRMSVKVTRKFYLFFLTLFFKNELLFSRNMMFYQLYIMFSYCRICTAMNASKFITPQALLINVLNWLYVFVPRVIIIFTFI